jgi:hypothetical protein
MHTRRTGVVNRTRAEQLAHVDGIQVGVIEQLEEGLIAEDTADRNARVTPLLHLSVRRRITQKCRTYHCAELAARIERSAIQENLHPGLQRLVSQAPTGLTIRDESVLLDISVLHSSNETQGSLYFALNVFR